MTKAEIKSVRLKQKEANKYFEKFLKLDKEIWDVCEKNLPKKISDCENEKEIQEVISFINFFYSGFSKSYIYRSVFAFIFRRRYELGIIKDK